MAREYRIKRRSLNASAIVAPPTKRQIEKLANVFGGVLGDKIRQIGEELRERGEHMIRFAFRVRFGSDARREMAFFASRHAIELRELPHDWLQAICPAHVAEKLLRWEIRGKQLVVDIEWREARVGIHGTGAGPKLAPKRTQMVLAPLPGIEEPGYPLDTLPGYHLRKTQKQIVRR